LTSSHCFILIGGTFRPPVQQALFGGRTENPSTDSRRRAYNGAESRQVVTAIA
jgi:hypothetical protein